MTTTRQVNILLVEDDIAHAEIVQRNLEQFEDRIHALVHVGDGQAALDYLQAGLPQSAQPAALPDLILLDLRLPRVDGLEVLRRVKSDAQLKRIPVVVLTTSDTDADVNGAYARGANGYMVKPVEYEGLLALTQAFGAYWLNCNLYSYA